MTIGSNGNDTLTTSGAGDVLIGLNGNDTLTSTHLDTVLFGDAGADDIDSTGLFVFGGGTQVNAITQSGGAGSDDLFADVKVDTVDDNILNGVFSGGNDGDIINATVAGSSSGGGTGNVTINAVADGGNGDDSISVYIRGKFERSGHA